MAEALQFILGLGYAAEDVLVDNKLNWSAIDEKGLLRLANLKPAKPEPVEVSDSTVIDPETAAEMARIRDEHANADTQKTLATARRAIQMMLVAKGLGEPAKIVDYVQALGVPLELNADALPALEKLTLEQLVQIRDGAAQ